MRRSVRALIVTVGAAASMAAAQESQQIIYQVAHPDGTWSNAVAAMPGDRIEFRVMINYTGTRTDLLGLGNARFQPTFSNFDNTGEGSSRDSFEPFTRNGGSAGGPNPPPWPTMVTPEEAQSTAPVMGGYGRVFPFGSTAMNAASFNVLTDFRHDGGSHGAPQGSWARLAGGYCSNWPQASLAATPVPTGDLLNILRGVATSQLAQASAGTAWQGGTQNITVFRGAILLSADNPDVRTIEMGVADGSLLRVGNAESADDSRYIAWQQSATDLGSYRVLDTQVLGANIMIVPAPAGAALLAAGLLVAARRRG